MMKPVDGERQRELEEYFTDAGFTVLGMEGLNWPFDRIHEATPHEIAAFHRGELR